MVPMTQPWPPPISSPQTALAACRPKLSSEQWGFLRCSEPRISHPQPRAFRSMSLLHHFRSQTWSCITSLGYASTLAAPTHSLPLGSQQPVLAEGDF